MGSGPRLWFLAEAPVISSEMTTHGDTRLGRLLGEVRAYLTHWIVAGVLITITGFAPEHWVATALDRIALPVSLRGQAPGSFDVRIALVAIGASIVTWEVRSTT